MNDRLIVDKIFSDGLVLQRDTKNKIYGYDKPGQKIKLSLCNVNYETYANESGYWEILLDKKENSGPHQMLIQGSKIEIIGEVFFGEVFLIGGQSNMETPISRVFDLYEKELLDYFNSKKQAVIHQFTMAKEYAFTKEEGGIGSGKWSELSPDTAEFFSAIGYFFARKYQSDHKGLNIGLIQVAVGGSPIEAWCDEELIRKYRKKQVAELEKCRRENYIKNQIEAEEKKLKAWMKDLLERDIYKNDPRKVDLLSDPNSNKIKIPVKYSEVEELKDISGILWLQKAISLTSHMISKINQDETYLYMGTIVDGDEIWVNGMKVGSTSYQYPPRKYKIAKGLLIEGKNIITIKQYIHYGQGEFVVGKPYYIRTKARRVEINLEGDWNYKIGATTSPQPPITFFTGKPTALYHGMIYPLRKIRLKGILWYQGESNTEDEQGYGELFQQMIMLLRREFKSRQLAFAFVQLVNYGQPQIFGAPGPWAKLRKEQEKGALLDKVAMVVGIDQGEAFDIHPLGKKTIGKRLAISMKNLISGKSQSHQGPILKEVLEKEDKWILTFKNTGQGLKIKKAIYFSLYCKKQNAWIKAKGSLEGKDKINITKPKEEVDISKVAYAYLDNPRYVSLYNSENFPARPFVYEFPRKDSKR